MPGNTSRRSSRTSVISVDPVVARHIAGAAKSMTTHTGHSRTESTPAQTSSSQLSALAKGHGRTNSVPSRNLKKRSHSLKRVKDSTEILRQKPPSVEKNTKQTESSGSKRGRNFTVSNVGTGGTLHLSPSPHQGVFSPAAVASSPYTWISPTAPTALPPSIATTLPSQPPQTRTRSVSPKRLIDRAKLSKASKEITYRHSRSQSFSTIDESRRSIAAAPQPQTLRIVINRPESVHSSDEEGDAPTLQIPIPSYRIGTPRFSAHGTPFIRGSSYTKDSGAHSTTHSSMVDGFGGPPPSSLKAFQKLQHSIPANGSNPHMSGTLHTAQDGDLTRSLTMAELTSPISVELYDQLTTVYNSPSVVRYANSEKDIAAATKIRIIAQISSESFMDYDLVSDFFLTFRSYMTTFEVLDYLLVRLKWSVGRLSDDGRIIRIRTFAALRHWILNYFAEDFVVNRQLRVRFCNEVNGLYESVRQRPKGTGGVSDLKILQDLKRCWNGRCALYWDAEQFNMDNDQEEALLPGGVLGSRNPAYADISEATAALGLGLQNMPESSCSPLPSTPSMATRKTYHKRLPSSDHAKKPQSIISDKSLQPTSCTIPRRRSRSPKRDSGKSERGPQPVSVLSRRHNAPSDLKVQIQPRRDDDEEEYEEPVSSVQTPVEALVHSGHYIDPHAGSMIRGFVYGPVEPFVRLPINAPPSPSVRFSADPPRGALSRVPPSPSSPFHGNQGPAVKNIFGSIRRALSGKQGTNEVTVITISPPPPTTSTARKAPVPLNLARSNDDLRRRATGTTSNTQLRIDLLGAAAVQSFQTVVPGTQPLLDEGNPQRFTPYATEQTLGSLPFSPPLNSIGVKRPEYPPARLPSDYTEQSGSILIVDDTAVAMPVMSGALPDSYVHEHEQSKIEHLRSDRSDLQHASFQTQIAFENEEAGTSPVDTNKSQEMSSTTSTAQTLGLRVGNRTSSNVTVTALQPSPELHEGPSVYRAVTDSLRSTSPPPMTEATSNSESPVSRAPAHGLRRRPGGDLRKNQNVQDLEPAMHHQSLDSMLDSSSAGGSLLIMGRPKTATSPATPQKKSQKVSMINTNSSQNLRPSFQAAISGFSAIPDDDDGGLEATLLKLEGRYEDPSQDGSNASPTPDTGSFVASSELPMSASTVPTDYNATDGHAIRQDKEVSMAERSFLHDETVDPLQEQAPSRLFAHQSAVFGLPTVSPAESDSDSSEISLPILKRSTTIGRAVTTDSPQPTKAAAGRGDDKARSRANIPSSKHIEARGTVRPGTALTDTTKSFLLEEDEDISDLSSEISVDILTHTNGVGKSASPMLAAPGTAISGLEIPSHPLTHASLVNLSLHTSPALAGPASFITQLPTPQQSPLLDRDPATPRRLQDARQSPSNNQLDQSVQPPSSGPAHVPFVLACESDVLAQQLTIVEQSALTEIEWTDLVEMRWSNDKSTSSLDWAEYMTKHDDARGIDVVTTRFNLVIKWVLSEIVLTQDIEERARVLSKFIHVAAHARRLRNYATMLQITIALMSTSCTRLKGTWELVPGPDKSLLKHMEKLAQPMRNFNELRMEMESTDLSSGCIPFLMLYVHDLTYNAQKPAEIHIEEGAEPLINFERFRTAAIIVKGLLRLIDASLRYDFEPIHGIVERCLWLSALTDKRIDALSKSLE
ncbi:Guanine nucleotide exchange factor lte1 [Lithohypha guttulata]|uniref:Guanine nucleotide exchange factor lte1 n=1 Tax=Lithohypha guttulata TaxID=1690604 RepID=UPI002DE1DC41|nr:Guanine nucleotide exchange factor lte1 [Lithohypha guttulata]KAK5106712.1 Guanine nucleotide exchange factor lte1 [Lithohypha guttulata]